RQGHVGEGAEQDRDDDQADRKRARKAPAGHHPPEPAVPACPTQFFCRRHAFVRLTEDTSGGPVRPASSINLCLMRHAPQTAGTFSRGRRG
ncbi:hypothetical protein DBT54_10265, partial [Aerococcus loyolae]